jgi:hypothetical protein
MLGVVMATDDGIVGADGVVWEKVAMYAGDDKAH